MIAFTSLYASIGIIMKNFDRCIIFVSKEIWDLSYLPQAVTVNHFVGKIIFFDNHFFPLA